MQCYIRQIQTPIKFSVVIQPTNAYKRVRISSIINTVCHLDVSATPVAILREVYYKVILQKLFEPVHKYKILIFKRRSWKHIDYWNLVAYIFGMVQNFFCIISCVVHLPEDGHKCGRNM